MNIKNILFFFLTLSILFLLGILIFPLFVFVDDEFILDVYASSGLQLAFLFLLGFIVMTFILLIWHKRKSK